MAATVGARAGAAEVADADADGGAAASGPPELELACPICHAPLERREGSLYSSVLGRSYPLDARGVADLTLTAGFETYAERAPAGQTTFESPLVSYAYERGWRQGFAWAGFPGADDEFETSSRYLRPAAGAGSTLVDLSCGSGLFTRRFAGSGEWGRVVAVDYSEAMLAQAAQFLSEEQAKGGASMCPVSLVRADAARLPFATASVDAIHAGAALHCWPSPLAALAEISRVLKPGGVFVASTFLDQVAPLGELIGDDKLVNPLSDALRGTVNANLPYRWWTESELKELVAIAGLTDYERLRERQYIHFTARKPESA
eukprot:PRCOL_00002952-RA